MVRDPYVSGMMARSFSPPMAGGVTGDMNGLTNALTSAGNYSANVGANVSNIGGIEGKISLTTLSLILLVIVGFYLWTHGYQA